MGIVSFGIGCGRAGVPGVYTMVDAFKPWLERTVIKYVLLMGLGLLFLHKKKPSFQALGFCPQFSTHINHHYLLLFVYFSDRQVTRMGS